MDAAAFGAQGCIHHCQHLVVHIDNAARMCIHEAVGDAEDVAGLNRWPEYHHDAAPFLPRPRQHRRDFCKFLLLAESPDPFEMPPEVGQSPRGHRVEVLHTIEPTYRAVLEVLGLSEKMIVHCTEALCDDNNRGRA